MCQLIEYDLMVENPTIFGSVWQLCKRLARFSKNRIYLIGYRIKTIFWGTKNRAVAAKDPDFQPGDMVRVRLKAQILPTLDGRKRYEGCRFVDEMWQFCGGTYAVLKSVRQILDERELKVKKLKNVYILDGLICEGSWPFKNCDRSCFYFWKAAWLEKINGAR
jgi:hypothetical protein